MFDLRYYQKKAVDQVRQALIAGQRRIVMVAPTGAGKSAIYAEIIRLALGKGKRCLFLVHRRNLVMQMVETLRHHGVEDVGVIMAGEQSAVDAPVQVATIQTLSRRLSLDELAVNRFYIPAEIILCDECFTGDTVISTPAGGKKIDVVRCGDIVYNQSGVGVVQRVFARPTADKLYTVRLDNGEQIECTGDHPFFTGDGWTKARELGKGAYLFSTEGMRLLWAGIPPVDQGRNKQKNGPADKNESVREGLEEAKILLNIVREEDGKPYERQSGAAENASDPAPDQAQAYQARRERAITALATASASARARGGVGVGGSCAHKIESGNAWLSYLLQNRHSQSGQKNSDRDRRAVTHRGEAGGGQEKDRISYFPRVVSVEVVEPASPRTVYNLQVSGHPSYFANGVAVHNCHTCVSKRYQDVLGLYDDKVIIGCTATPMRADGRGLGEVFGALVDVVGVQELTDQGFLAPARYFVPPSQPNLEGVKVARGDYEVGELGKRMTDTKLIGDIVDNWLRIASGRKTIVFCVNVKHAVAVAEQFRRVGVSATHLSAKSPDEVREQAFRDMDNGNLQVICNVALYVEGMDCPAISCVVMARPTKSLGLYRQACGRGLRPNGTETIIIDHGGVVEEHGLLTDDLEWSLDGKEKAWKRRKKKEKPKRPSKCTVCDLVFEGASVCPDCGSPIKTFGKPVATEEADLEEFGGKKKATMVEKRRLYGMMEHYRRQRGYKPGWTYWKYKARFGVEPRGMSSVAPIPPDDETLRWIKHQYIRHAKQWEARVEKGGSSRRDHNAC